MLPRSGALALPALLAIASCSGAPPAPSAPSPAPASAAPKASGSAAAGAPRAPAPNGLVEMVTPSRLLPDLVGQRGVVAHEDGYRRVLLDRMRLVARDDGSIERAAELLPPGNVSSVALPSRLGGGFLFHANTGSGTQIWRAPTWLGKLRPLVSMGQVASEILPGFDRLYVRLQTNNRLMAIDPESGDVKTLAPLPPASSYGRLAFADGWRAVVDTDLRGPLATFDAGMTWRPVGLSDRATSIDIVSGDPAIAVAGGRYLVDARGAVTFRADAPREPGAPMDEADPAARPPGPLGKRPLRAALEDGWPDSPKTVVVARGGSLGRVSLEDGHVIAVTEEAYPDRLASCHALRVGSGFGFLCGERDGATSIYRFSPPLSMTPILRFAKPRFVAPSGNGALVTRGSCSDAAPPDGDARTYCVYGVTGALREIRVKGDLGVERVVALGDGRVAVLVPPRGGSAGQLTLLDGASAASVALKLPTEPRSVARELRRGMWLDGFEEREKGVLGGWIEAGGPVIGVRIALDGKVTAGDLRDDANGAILSGRFGLSLGEGGRAAESTDGGMHWEVLDLPDRDEEATRAGQTRACGPAGCVLGGWIRVGWGKPAAADDMRPADPPPAPYTPLKTAPALGLACELGASATPPAIAAIAPAAASPGRRPPAIKILRPGPTGGGILGALGRRLVAPPGGGATTGPATPNGWLSFRNTPAPALAPDEIGLDNGPYADTVMLRAYAWGKRGADWTRSGRWMVRFDDRFDASGGVRQSAITTSLWSDEGLAAEAIGTGSYGAAAWNAFLDPSGRAALTQVCRGSSCSFYSVADGQPVLPVRDAQGRTGSFFKPFGNGAVRVGETWFFVAPGTAQDIVTLWRVDLGVARQIATYYRSARYGLDAPRMVRRALGGGVGLLVGGALEPGERAGGGSWYVLPVSPETGELGEAVLLVRRDLADVTLERCAPGQDGWLFDTSFDTPPSVEVEGSYGSFENVEMRARLDPGSACVESLSARVDGLSGKPKAGTKPGGKPLPPKPTAGAVDEGGIPLSATERGNGRRWALTCRTKRGLFPPAKH